ncbi:MAG: hypothetical protein A2381_07245 [Bdellovibrionales bacterium RIFOXYB1_FULL_37_110]|nr:MAG: hypothetical protein A2181_06665 [Bdellovibrionales bacterium RIFOXYA1_FULL_38_20]OFZ45484.1 MAG: hypothetical protein A2417_18145 [Bdellovibrionales bacterium RIFOXYC1_FULL_37_79]OFZ53582.1 MAG: hypothetical protein A2328_04100 [Bdellovibrionales bacterium RIFOXYB2_FULL_36_6]OFZ60631.1 MAG: hypothetical protein A2381_07245 [Bdellovibrionales bacterium RIFOXYB1_FULL_37_110]OFZ63453.1 MAG: hypothetical protein A2577_06190 [Bdellovibrionales bacterium RIFOXYD1_FULL_36_51]
MVLRLFNQFDKIVEKISSAGLVVSIILILLLALLNIICRWVDLAVMWIDPLVRHLVFLCTFLGGVIATGRGTHVGIDIVSKYLENNSLKRVKKGVSRIIICVSLATLVWLIYASYVFFKVELEFGKPQFLGIHSGALVFIIPFGFSLIAYRFFNQLLNSLFKNNEDESC